MTTQSSPNSVIYQPDKTARLGGRIVIALERGDGCGQFVTDCCAHAVELRI